ncbi:hypothetical protein GWK47_001647 [Chionoecetes opilio]|uniref:Uncharacterized protein n=1 Tax=Chionoecetes opilio TaxID=41210 RepID=A0A8J4XT55_CHIOP|nr:hypothetical protein GWK47_001647 [Chionoecetes opilio]
MTLRVRGCRGGQPCPSEPAQLPLPTLRPSAAASIASHACHPQSDSFLAVAATSYTRLRRTSSYSRAGSSSLGPVLPSSHLLDQLASQARTARVTIAATPSSAGDPDTLAVPRMRMSSRSLREGSALPGPGGSSSTWSRKGKQSSLPPKRPGRFSSRRNRCNTGSTLAPPAFNRPARPSSSGHPPPAPRPRAQVSVASPTCRAAARRQPVKPRVRRCARLGPLAPPAAKTNMWYSTPPPPNHRTHTFIFTASHICLNHTFQQMLILIICRTSFLHYVHITCPIQQPARTPVLVLLYFTKQHSL